MQTDRQTYLLYRLTKYTRTYVHQVLTKVDYIVQSIQEVVTVKSTVCKYMS